MKCMPSGVGCRARALSGPAIFFAMLLTTLVAAAPASAGDVGEPSYSLAADAAAGFVAASPSLDPGAAGTAALWTLSANFLHRFGGRGWGAVLNHTVDLSGNTALLGLPLAFSGSVHEAYARVDLGEAASLAIGKRRMQLGIGTAFAPGDMINPRSGFWDQKDGFRGISFAGSVGADLSLRAALSFDRNLDAYAAATKAAQALAAYGATDPRYAAAAAAAATALDGAAGSADPALFIWAGSAELQLGTLQIALGGNFQPDRVARPSLGLSADIAGLILQAEGAVEFMGAPDWYGTAGARYTLYSDAFELSLSLDGEYGGGRGLEGTLYLLPVAFLSITDKGAVFVRSLVDLDGGSALLSTGLTLSFLPDFEIELTGAFGIGKDGAEFSRLPAPLGSMRSSAGLAARIHF